MAGGADWRDYGDFEAKALIYVCHAAETILMGGREDWRAFGDFEDRALINLCHTAETISDGGTDRLAQATGTCVTRLCAGEQTRRRASAQFS